MPKTIPDASATKPEDWDDSEDGEWEPPAMPNPEYKGEWRPKMIDNPNYKARLHVTRLIMTVQAPFFGPLTHCFATCRAFGLPP